MIISIDNDVDVIFMKMFINKRIIVANFILFYKNDALRVKLGSNFKTALFNKAIKTARYLEFDKCEINCPDDNSIVVSRRFFEINLERKVR